MAFRTEVTIPFIFQFYVTNVSDIRPLDLKREHRFKILWEMSHKEIGLFASLRSFLSAFCDKMNSKTIERKQTDQFPYDTFPTVC